MEDAEVFIILDDKKRSSAMILICEECGKKFRIDSSKINENKISFKCKNCGHQIVTDIPNLSTKEPVPL